LRLLLHVPPETRSRKKIWPVPGG